MGKLCPFINDKKRDKSADMNKRKKKIILTLILLFAFLVIGFIVYLNMMSMSTTIHFRNKTMKDTNISNVKLISDLGKPASKMYENYYVKKDNDGVYTAIHRAGYGNYTYSFDVDLGDKIITPKISVFKTNWQDKYDVEIDFVVTLEGSACITVCVNGSEMYQEIEDIENNEVVVQFGP